MLAHVSPRPTLDARCGEERNKDNSFCWGAGVLNHNNDEGRVMEREEREKV